MSGGPSGEKVTRIRRKIVELNVPSRNREKNLSIKKVSDILKKNAEERTAEENEILKNSRDLAAEATSRMERQKVLKQRSLEFEDTDETLDLKCRELANALAKCKNLVVYTGAGISTAARIPDYRGTAGIWTLLQQGKDIGSHDLTQAEPTYTHMALSELYRRGKLLHVVSQNCDGLHLRSGLPRTVLSEVHGNMYIEVCRQCRPIAEYLRLFDVTENTARFNHRTYRRCYKCNSPLVDSIVHFGERGNLPWPLHWKGACKAAEKADVILCMGSSLKVLKRYPWLWSMDRPAKRRPKLYIVNLQWTPKDCHAVLKIHGRCDAVMRRVMKHLDIQVPDYDRKWDPIFTHATALCPDEQHTTDRPQLIYDEAAEPGVVEKKEDLIVITVGSEPKTCCTQFAQQQASHDRGCNNFVDAAADIPVIFAPPVTSDVPFNPFLLEAMFYNYFNILINSLGMAGMGSSTSQLLKRPLDEPSQDEERNLEVKKPRQEECGFCWSRFESAVCLFYRPLQPEFREEVKKCLCCGDDEDEEEHEQEQESAEKNSEDVKDVSVNETDKVKAPINPGWYGKGWRKRVKKKR